MISKEADPDCAADAGVCTVNGGMRRSEEADKVDPTSWTSGQT